MNIQLIARICLLSIWAIVITICINHANNFDSKMHEIVIAQGIVTEKKDSPVTCQTASRTCYSYRVKINNEFHETELATYDRATIGSNIKLVKYQRNPVKFSEFASVVFIIASCFVMLCWALGALVQLILWLLYYSNDISFKEHLKSLKTY